MFSALQVKKQKPRSFRAWSEVTHIVAQPALEPSCHALGLLGNSLLGSHVAVFMQRCEWFRTGPIHSHTGFCHSEKRLPHCCHFLDREICISASWVQSSSNYKSLEGSEKKHQGRLTTLTDLQIIIYSNTEHFLCGGKDIDPIIHVLFFFFLISLNPHRALCKQTENRKGDWAG